MLFNRNGLAKAKGIAQPTADEIKATPSLWNASLDDAIKFGGDLTRAALGAMNIRGDKKYVIVDSKVHMLAPGQYPALPGWHTDGTPRFEPDVRPDITVSMAESWLHAHLHPQNKGLPFIDAQEYLDSPRFHLLVTGHGCLTQFIRGDVELDTPEKPSRDLYAGITRQTRELVEAGKLEVFDMPSCTSVEWDWWTLHQAQAAKRVEWRYLIRVTESDHNEPQDDLRKVIRTQNQVFVPTIDTGW